MLKWHFLIRVVYFLHYLLLVASQTQNLSKVSGAFMAVQFCSASYKVSLCSASILNRYFLLNAAHCYPKELEPWTKNCKYRIGSHNKMEGGHVLDIIKVYIHEDYKIETLEDGSTVPLSGYDLALGRVKRMEFSDSVQPIPLMTPNMTLPKDEPFTTAGWSMVSSPRQKQPDDKKLQWVNLTLVSQKEKQDFLCEFFEGHSTVLSSRIMILVGDPCTGIGFGPLVIRGTTPHPIQVGISSMTQCPAPDAASLFTPVWHYIKWIKRKMRESKKL